jgi:alanyl-tRNA synthetase
MKEAMAQVGGRGGGTKDMAQGGCSSAEHCEALLDDIAARLQ